MPRDAAATRGRILDAAISEFASYGLAGARIDRIAEVAQANKRSIYVYFNNKEDLFSAALHAVISEVAQTIPVTIDDLPAYAGNFFDYLLTHPQALRLGLWRRLERPTSGPDEAAVYAAKIAAMTSAQCDQDGNGLPPIDLIMMIITLAQTWFISPDDLRAADGSDPTSPERIASHRAALIEAARRLCTPSNPPVKAAG
jgi:AcrR family transcriptional regulator